MSFLTATTMSSTNGLICFTNCLLPQEDGSLIKKDLWVDETCGLILDAQVCRITTEDLDSVLSLYD